MLVWYLLKHSLIFCNLPIATAVLVTRSISDSNRCFINYHLKCGPRDRSPKESCLKTSQVVGHDIVPLCPIHLFEKILSRYCRTFWEKCAELRRAGTTFGSKQVVARLQAVQVTLFSEILHISC